MDLLDNLIQAISINWPDNSTSDHFKENYVTDVMEEDPNKLVIDLLKSFKDWKRSIEFIESQCSLHDYKDIQANGYRSQLKMNQMAIERVNKILSQRSLTGKHLLKSFILSRLLTKINNKIEEFYTRDQKYKQNLINNNINDEEDEKSNELQTVKPFISKNLFHSGLSADLFEFYDGLEQDLADYFRYHAIFYYRKDLRKAAKLLITSCSIASNLPTSLLFDKKKRSQTIAKLLHNPTISFPFSVIDQIDCRAYTDVVIPMKYLTDSLSTSTVYLPRQYRFLLNDLQTCLNTKDHLTIDHRWSYELLKPTNSVTSDKIRVRIIKDKTTIKNNTVLFHVHGEYPKAQQDILDSYLWLISGQDEVAEVFGFQPEKIVICGDSAGAFFCFTLMHLLIDFNKKIEHDKLPVLELKCPDAFVSFYGYYNLSTPTPSLIMNCLDFFLPPTNIKIAFGSLIWGIERPKFKKRIILPWFADKKQRWYNSKDLRELCNEMTHTFDQVPYLCSNNYFDYDTLKIPLYLVTSDWDVCLDHNVDLANRWKGEVSMIVLENQIHGFLQLESGDKTIREDISKCCDLLRMAVDRL